MVQCAQSKISVMAIGVSSRSVLWNNSSVPFLNKWSNLVMLDMLNNFDVNSRVNENKLLIYVHSVTQSYFFTTKLPTTYPKILFLNSPLTSKRQMKGEKGVGKSLKSFRWTDMVLQPHEKAIKPTPSITCCKFKNKI